MSKHDFSKVLWAQTGRTCLRARFASIPPRLWVRGGNVEEHTRGSSGEREALMCEMEHGRVWPPGWRRANTRSPTAPDRREAGFLSRNDFQPLRRGCFFTAWFQVFRQGLDVCAACLVLEEA